MQRCLCTCAVAALIGTVEIPATRAAVLQKPEPASVRKISTLRGSASRRGPATGLQWVPSTDSDYRRTERLRFEVASGAANAATARLLGPVGTPISVPISVTVRVDDITKQPIVVAELILAPLAQAEYELELTIDEASEQETVTYRFAVVP